MHMIRKHGLLLRMVGRVCSIEGKLQCEESSVRKTQYLPNPKSLTDKKQNVQCSEEQVYTFHSSKVLTEL